MLRPAEDAPILTAFCQRQGARLKYGLSTDGTTLWDQFGELAKWSDATRIILNSDRDVGGDLEKIERFLSFWCRYYIIGVSRTSFAERDRTTQS